MQDHASKLKGLAWLLAGLLVGSVCAAGLAPLAHLIPWQWEERAGALADIDLGRRECPSSPDAERLMAKIEKRLYPVEPKDNRFKVAITRIRSPDINAYAGLGGKIFVTSSLIEQAETPEELAGVLAHEMGHVEKRHIMEATLTHIFTTAGLRAVFGGQSAWAAWADFFLKMNFTRRQERQADDAALERLAAAHIDNKGFRHFFERMSHEEEASPFLSDHPSNAERIERIAGFANPPPAPLMSGDEWKKLKLSCRSKAN